MQATAKLSIILPVYDLGEYAKEIIESIKLQTIKNWECIVVDRGSKDGTGELVSSLIEDDDRFHFLSIEESDKGLALNRGMELAKGRYLAFYDTEIEPDRKYYEIMYNTAFRNKADMAIGNQTYFEKADTAVTRIFHIEKEEHLSGSPAYLKKTDVAVGSLSYLRSNDEIISPLDPILAKSLRLGDKLFSRDLIEAEKIRFGKGGCREEENFCMLFAVKSRLICGCKDAKCFHRDMPASESQLPTTISSKESFADAVSSFEREASMAVDQYNAIKAPMADIPENTAAVSELENRYNRFRSALYCSFVRDAVIEDCFRHIWMADGDVIQKAAEILKTYRAKIFPNEWKEMLEEEGRDLILGDDGNLSRADMLEAPLISFVVSGIKDSDRLNRILECIYCQDSPCFEVIVQDEIYASVADRWKKMPNMRSLRSEGSVFKKTAYEECRGKYLWYIDMPVFFCASTVRDMYRSMREYTGVLFVSAPMAVKGDLSTSVIPANSVAFIPEFARQKRKTSYNELDFFWINKIISVAKLNAMKDPFGQGDVETLARFYKNSRHYKNDGILILTELTDEDILSRAHSSIVKLLWKCKLKKEEQFLEQLKMRDRHRKTLTSVRKKSTNDFIRFATLKVMYPFIYNVNKILPVNQKKVIFVEPAKLEIDGNLVNVMRAIEEIGDYKVMQLCLGRKFVRVRDQIKREAHFVKEMATARYVFTAEALGVIGGFEKRKGTTLVQLWHGCGAFKQFGYSTADYLFGGDIKEKNAYPGYRNADIITVSSPEVIWAYQEAMGYKNTDVVQATGVSRTDVFFDEEFIKSARDRVYEAAPDAAGKKIILYAPTFRGTIKRAKAPDRLDIRAMKEAFGDEYYLIIKHHPFVKVPPIVPEECADFAINVSGKANIDDLICCADICISDYSSLVFEYSLFERPMIFFAYDIERYDDWRGFYYDYEELTPGPVVYTTEEIIDYIKNVDKKFDRDEVIRFREKFMSACDGHATERILGAIDINVNKGTKGEAK